MAVRHATASALVWWHSLAGWRLGLVEHPLFGLLLPPGGHVEADENVEQAVRREVTEETGLTVDLVAPSGTHVPVELPCATVALPWWICEHPIPRDNHLAEPHIHVDHKYVALTSAGDPSSTPELPFAWYDPTQLPRLDVPDDTRVLARWALDAIETLAARQLLLTPDAESRER